MKTHETVLGATVLMAVVSGGTSAQAETTPEAVLDTYADIALATFEDSLITARRLSTTIDALIETPSAEHLDAAKQAWIAARVPYQQSEVYRFGNPIVDDWEGKVNAWPLDEGLIDYVDAGYPGGTDTNASGVLNVIANPTFVLGGKAVNADVITPALLEDTLQEADGIEANVATGYHAIEFLLWGQDLNGTREGNGARAWTDFAKGEECTNENCDRRAAYLDVVTDLLISDLEWMTSQWGEGGAARVAVMADEGAGISAMLTGMGSLSYGELAGERMRLGLMLNDPEEEHDCFSDNTHNSHFYDGMGVQNVYLGKYVRVDGNVISGAALADLVAAEDAALDLEMRMKLSATMMALGRIKTAAESGFAYDQMLEAGSATGEALVMGGVNRLIAQTQTIQEIAAKIGVDKIAVEGSDSLDDPTAVFQ